MSRRGVCRELLGRQIHYFFGKQDPESQTGMGARMLRVEQASPRSLRQTWQAQDSVREMLHSKVTFKRWGFARQGEKTNPY